MNSHVFSSEGCRLVTFCPATVDGAHVVYCEERARTEIYDRLRPVKARRLGRLIALCVPL